MPDYDAVVIGAGPAGSTAALLLARAGWSVAIVEKATFPRRKVCGEFISAAGLSLLARLGVAGDVLAAAGPEVREVGVYAGERIAIAPMPKAEGGLAYGRALGRDRLDAALLQAAREAGAVVHQPWRVGHCARVADHHVCSIASHSREEARALTARVLIAAHGSWDTGRLPVRGVPQRALPSDLLAFKAHYTHAALPPGRMPLIAFPGGYGGLVHTDGGRVSFSCCVRRDVLSACRSRLAGASAGDAVLQHAIARCRGLREALEGAVREDAWLAAGPLRPGFRSISGGGYFAVGNALGEAHPIVAEGISMGIQSAWLLSERLIRAATSLDAIGRDYEAAYRFTFGPRMRSAALFAALAMRPWSAGAAAALLAAVPATIALGARYAGKATVLRA